MSVSSELLGQSAGPTVDPDASASTDIAARSPLELFWRRLRADKVAMVALAFVILLILIAVFAPLIIKIAGTPKPDLQQKSALDQFGTATGPSSAHPFGVDNLGRDVFSRVVYGARVSLEVALISTFFLVLIGVVVGLLAGYFRSWVDSILSRTMDVLLAFPILLFALGLASACSLGSGCIKAQSFGQTVIWIGLGLCLVALAIGYLRFRRGKSSRNGFLVPIVCAVFVVLLGLFFRIAFGKSSSLINPGLGVVIFVIAAVGWPYIARIVRGQVLSLREKEFVESARSLGASDGRIIFREILPNLVAPIIVYSTLVIPQNILFEAALSYLGVGVQPPQSSWGQMLSDATRVYQTAPWFMIFPGVALLVTVLAFNLLGDGLQDALNPRQGK